MTAAFDSKELAHTVTCSKSEEKRHEGNGTNKARICMRPNLTHTLNPNLTHTLNPNLNPNLTHTLNPNLKVLLLSDLRTRRGD